MSSENQLVDQPFSPAPFLPIAHHFLSLFSLSLLSPFSQALSCPRPGHLHPQQLHAAAMSQIFPRRTRKQHKIAAMHPRGGGRHPLRHPGWDNRPRSSCLDPHRILRQRHQSPCGASPHPRPHQISPHPLSLSGGMQRMRNCAFRQAGPKMRRRGGTEGGMAAAEPYLIIPTRTCCICSRTKWLK